jgi:hypothetical protein
MLDSELDDRNNETISILSTLEKSIYEKELEQKDIEDGFIYVNEKLDEHNKFEVIIKSKLILMMAEKLEKSKYPQLDIIDRLIEEFAGRISEQHIRRSLPDRFKKLVRVTAQKKANETKIKNKAASNGSSSITVLEDPVQQFKSDDSFEREKLNPDFTPNIASDFVISSEITSSSNDYVSPDYIKSLEKLIKALNGQIPYTDCLATHKIMKMDKIKAIQLDEAMKASLKEVFVIVDIRTNQITTIYTDKEFNKRIKNDDNI